MSKRAHGEETFRETMDPRLLGSAVTGTAIPRLLDGSRQAEMSGRALAAQGVDGAWNRCSGMISGRMWRLAAAGAMVIAAATSTAAQTPKEPPRSPTLMK